MKLIYCSACGAIVRLSLQPGFCDCGKSWGKYYDNSFATYGGKAVPMIILNSEFVKALTHKQTGEHESGLLDFTAGFIPKNSKTFMDESDERVPAIAQDIGPGPKMRCTYCSDIIQSTFRHDFVKCKCGKSFIDGGGVYTRCGGSLEPVEEKPA